MSLILSASALSAALHHEAESILRQYGRCGEPVAAIATDAAVRLHEAVRLMHHAAQTPSESADAAQMVLL